MMVYKCRTSQSRMFTRRLLLMQQLRSANKFLRMDSIREWILIAPEAKVPTLVHYLEDKLAHLPCVLVSKVGPQ